ncbi:gliding motility-associated C-terminal domain-containing protein, partial [Flavobacteriaceae bacterium]|nr:gliding motility-associated C-terminal domain-containing protein [Flavobacteriaceae bacterium]
VESLPITFTTSNVGGNTSYTWEVITSESDEIGLIENQGAGNIPSFIPINSGFDQLEALIEVTPLFTNDDSDCAGISELFKIIVIPSADVIQPEDITVCNGELVSVIFETNNLVGLTTYSWTSSIDIGAGLFDDGNILFNAVNEPNQNTISTLITVTAQIDNLGVICDGPTQTFTINVNGNIDAKPTISNYNGFEISCFDANDGFINLNPEGGSPFTNDPQYIYSWIGPNGFTSNEQNISNLVPGTYDLIITDSLGCNFEFQYIINEPDQLEIIVDNETDILCNGVSSGEILITPAGGTGSYLYEWTKDGLPYSELQDLVGLSAGTYVLFLYDSNDCGPVSEIFEITEPTAIESDIDLLVDILCFGDATGSIDLTISGGTPFILPSGDFEYTYNWIGPNGFSANTEDIVNLIAGIYTLTVTDNVGCQMIFEYELTQPEDLIINYTSTNNSCYESDDGTISLEITGGVAPYNIAWSNLGNGPIQTNLSAGDYEVIVTDFHDCVESIIINIVEAPLFDIDPVSNDISCFGANDGYINLNISGGVPPMTVTWDDDLTAGVERNNLSAGTYTVLIVDSSGNNCSITQSFVILEPQELSLSSIIENAIDCEVVNSGSIDLQVVGGSPPYSFQWNNGSTQEDLFNIAPGNYSVSVIDSRDCEIVENFAVERQEDITTSLDITFEADCENDIPYQITTINVEGGVAPYEIIWSSGEVSGDNNETMTSSQNGTVIVDIVDFLGCESQVVFDIDLFELGSPGFNYSSPGLTECETLGVGDLIQFTNTSTGDYISVDWNFGDTGLTVINEENPTHIYNQPGTYVVTQTVYYEYGCVDVFEDILYVTIGYGLVLPNAFTPNGDGINDTIRPWFKCMTNVEISIYDTFGSLLYVEAGEEIYGWDGSINGKMAENGNYIIVVRATTLFGEIIDLNGPITLIR